jgi:hypothetical protein
MLQGAMIVLLLTLGLGLAGCPPVITDPDAEYDLGFEDGFALDAKYWEGYDDSYDTVDAGPIYYSGGSIPYVTTPPYDAGYWDGVWYAYNDGYFVAYDYAFTIGFSEGYDMAYRPGWSTFLANDVHIEYLDGGFSDGYNDGFSEGRVFGAWDYNTGWAFDWLDAMMDYRSGADLTIGGVGTGEYGPVYLYEYGTDPNDFLKSAGTERKARGALPAIRTQSDAKSDGYELSYRAFTPEARSALDVAPTASPRGDREVTLKSTWLQRVNAYLDALQ